MTRTWKTVSGVAVAFSMLLVTQAFGQAQRSDEARKEAQQQRQQAGQQAGQQKLCLASKLTEMSVKDKSNQAIGQIEDLVIDEQGKVQYLAISTSGKAGQTRQPGQQKAQKAQAGDSTKLTLIPFEAAELHQGQTESQNYVSINMDKDRLTQAPSFTKQQLASQSQQSQWMSQVNRFFDREKTGAARPDLNKEKKNEQERENKKEDKEDK